jgi:oligopeptide transport system substrate-binding protein
MKYLPIIILMMCACSKQEETNTAESQLRISFHSPVPTVDPRDAGETLACTMINIMYEGLMRLSTESSVELGLAERIEVSPDQLTYTFHLRPSVWSDGTPLTASAFERTWKQILDPTTGATCAYLFFPLKNGERAYRKEVPPEEIGVRVLDDLTLEVTLEQPTSYFLSLTALPAYRPIPEHAESQFKNWTCSNKPFVSNGPFSLKKIEPQTELILQKNERFWNRENIHLDEINIAIIPNAHTNLQMFRNGELDWVGGNTSPLPIEDLQQYSGTGSLSNMPLGGTTFCAFNLEHPLLKNKNLRKALSLAINRKEIVEKITQMGETPATRFIPPVLMKSNKEKSLYSAFDPLLARHHLMMALEELSVERRALNTLVVYFDQLELDTRLALAIQREWKQVLGIDVVLEACEPQNHMQLVYRRDFQISLNWLLVQYADPMNVLERFEFTTNKKNYPGFDSPTYRECVQRARFATTDEDRMKAIENAEEALLDEMPFAPVYHWTHHLLSQPQVHDLETAHNGTVLIERTWITP